MKQILVVEDDKPVRSNITELLSGSGYEVIQAENGIEAFELLKDERPDLILSDIMMPLMDGMQLYAAIRKLDFMINTPFIFLTAKADIQTHNSAIKLGVEDYITKPFNSFELLNRIKVRLEKRRKIEEKFDKLKSDISLYVPHELQTPIFPIIGYCELILDDIDSFSRLELLEMVDSIHSSSLRLKERMVKFNKFADLRIQASEKYSKCEYDFHTKTSLNSILLESILLNNNQISKRKKDLKLKLTSCELPIAGNDLTNLISELLENACKFSNKDEKITLTGIESEDKYKLLFQNSGEQFVFDINEGFTQIRRDEKQQVGNGLGIAIVSLISKKYDLKIHSKYDTQNNVFVEFDLLKSTRQ